MQRAACVAVGVCILLPGVRASADDYVFVKILESSTRFVAFEAPSLNRCGVLACRATTRVGQALVVASEGETWVLAETNSEVPAFNQRCALSDTGEVAYWAQLEQGEAIYRAHVLTPGASELLIDTTGPFAAFGQYGNPTLNNRGQVAFAAWRDDDGRGVFRTDGRELVEIHTTRRGPTYYRDAAINEAGEVAFRVAFPESGIIAILRSPGGRFKTICYNYAPFLDLYRPSVNSHGMVAFSATLEGYDGEQTAVYIGDGGPPWLVADSTYDYARVGPAVGINDLEQVVFEAVLRSGEHGIFTGDDPRLDTVIRTGDVLEGSRVNSLRFAGNRAVNDAGQIAFAAVLSNGRSVLLRADPVRLTRCPGDLNGDRVVDLEDLSILVSCFKRSACGDLNCDGVTDEHDLALLLSNYDRVCLL
jgi:hypothetical protein